MTTAVGGRDHGGPRSAAGFTLVEVLVALVVLEVGLLGVAGLHMLAVRRMAAAVELHRAVLVGEAVADSLLRAGVGSAVLPGERLQPPFRVRWEEGERGMRVVVLRADGGRELIRLLEGAP